MSELVRWFQKNKRRLDNLSRTMRNGANPFTSAQVSPETLERLKFGDKYYTDEFSREWYPLRYQGRKQFCISQLLIGTGVPVAPIIRKYDFENKQYNYFSYRIKTEALKKIDNDSIEDVWASDMVLRFVFYDLDRSVYPEKNHNIERAEHAYYLFDFDAANIDTIPFTVSFLKQRMFLFQKDFAGDGITVVGNFREKLSALHQRIEGSDGARLIAHTYFGSDNTDNMTGARHIQNTLLQRITAALQWTSTILGK